MSDCTDEQAPLLIQAMVQAGLASLAAADLTNSARTHVFIHLITPPAVTFSKTRLHIFKKILPSLGGTKVLLISATHAWHCVR